MPERGIYDNFDGFWIHQYAQSLSSLTNGGSKELFAVSE